MFELSIKSNVDQIQKQLSALAYKQLPFAIATAATDLAKEVKDAEVRNMQKVLDKPTPFTIRSVGVRAARKDLPIATIFVKDVAAEYLEPYEFGGTNKLNSKALLKPIDAKVNQYGNLPRTLISRLKSKKNIFFGAIKTKAGMVNGAWQRIPAQKGQPGRMKLLIRFAYAHQVSRHLGWFDVATKIVNTRFNKVFGSALARAMATAKH